MHVAGQNRSSAMCTVYFFLFSNVSIFSMPLFFTVSYCPEGWFGNPYVPNCYFVSSDRRTYDGSEAACRNYGGTLATIGSEFNNNIVQNAFGYSQEVQGSGDGDGIERFFFIIISVSFIF